MAKVLFFRLLLEHALENEEFNKRDNGADSNAEEHGHASALDASDNAEEGYEAYCAGNGLFNSDGDVACEECDNGADNGNYLVEYVYI